MREAWSRSGLGRRDRSRGTYLLLFGLVSSLVLVLVAPVGASAQQDPNEEYCVHENPPPPDAPPNPIRFGNTPLTAGSVGAVQEEPTPRDEEKDVAGMVNLRPPGKELIVRMNRMFWADGREGIDRYIAIADRYAEHGFRSESQVRYHPPEGKEGDMDAWEAYVREVAQVFGSRDHITALSITNEANIYISENTSDGAYDGVVEAIVVGTEAARDELDRMGREDIELGFSFAWRMDPPSDRDFWEELGELAPPEFIAATDYVGLQIYPGKVWPTVDIPNRSAGDEVVTALHLLRTCFMPKAGLEHVDLWITENGYGTNHDDSEEEQEAKLISTIEAVHEWSGSLGVTDYRWFNLRDNNTNGLDLFSAVGLLRDDYSDKPAYCTMRELIARYGTDAPGATGSDEVCGPLPKGLAETQPEPDNRDRSDDATEEQPPGGSDSELPATGTRWGGTSASVLASAIGLMALLRRRTPRRTPGVSDH